MVVEKHFETQRRRQSEFVLGKVRTGIGHMHGRGQFLHRGCHGLFGEFVPIGQGTDSSTTLVGQIAMSKVFFAVRIQLNLIQDAVVGRGLFMAIFATRIHRNLTGLPHMTVGIEVKSNPLQG